MQNVVNFEDIINLFSFNTYNRGLIRMDLDEAVYMFKLIKEEKTKINKTPLNIVDLCEIGTYKGGSTVLFRSAGARIQTYDNYSSKTFDVYKDKIQAQREAEKLLENFQLNS